MSIQQVVYTGGPDGILTRDLRNVWWLKGMNAKNRWTEFLGFDIYSFLLTEQVMISKTPLRFYSPQYDSQSYNFRQSSVRWSRSFFSQQYHGWQAGWVSTLNAQHEWAILKCSSEEQSKMMCNYLLQGRQDHKFCRPPKSEQALYTRKYSTFKYTKRSKWWFGSSVHCIGHHVCSNRGWSRLDQVNCTGMTQGGCAYFKENQALDMRQSQSSNIGSSSGSLFFRISHFWERLWNQASRKKSSRPCYLAQQI